MAAIQLCSQEVVQDNLEACRVWLQRAAEQGARLAVLPENFAFFGPELQRREIAESLDSSLGPIRCFCSELARQTRMVIVAGGFPERAESSDRPYNTCAVFDETGELVGRYRKIHLFDVELPDGSKLLESSGTTPGSQPVCVEAAGLRLGLSICYDLRFPELYRRLASEGAELLVVPAAFTQQTGRDHWHVLLRSRAIENQCWVVAAAQSGRHPGARTSYGHALLVDPWGRVVAECGNEPGLAMAELGLEQMAQLRRSFPVGSHRRL